MGTKITWDQRKRLEAYLKGFYRHYPREKFTIFHFTRYFKERLKNNKDCWMGVSGPTGIGKSRFVLTTQILFGRPFDLDSNVTYIPMGQEIMAKFSKLKFNTLLIDEAAKNLRAVQWQNRQQQSVNVAAMTERYLNNWVFLNMPNFAEFTKSLRAGSISFRAIVLYRAKNYVRIVIQRKNPNWRSDDPWYDVEANKKYEAMQKKYGEISNEIMLKIERGLPNTLMDFIIPDLEKALPEIIAGYEERKMESRKQQAEDEKSKDPFKLKYELLLEKVTKILNYNQLDIGRVKVTKQSMAAALGISTDRFNKYLMKDSRGVEATVAPKEETK